MQKIKSLQELKQLATEIPINVRENYGILGLVKKVQYFEFSDTWAITDMYNGFKYSYTTEKLILSTNLFKSILTGTLVVHKVV